MSSEHEGEKETPAVKTYLDQVEAPMRRVPEERRQSFRDEIQDHVETLIDEYLTAGSERPAAENQAFRMVGDPGRLGRSMVKSWYRSTEPGTILTAIGVESVVATFLGVVSSPSLILVQRSTVHNTHQLQLSLDLYMVVSVALYSLTAVSVGWFTPRRAVTATAIVSLLSGGRSLLSLVTNNMLRHATPLDGLSWLTMTQILVLPACSILFAWMSRRLRMYRRAGV